MEYLKIDGEFPRLSGSAVTLGKFDGIHRGFVASENKTAPTHKIQNLSHFLEVCLLIYLKIFLILFSSL